MAPVNFQKTNSKTCALLCTSGYGSVRLSQSEPVKPGSPTFYKEKAQELLDQAGRAATEEARTELLTLAEQWQRLAQRAEHPNW